MSGWDGRSPEERALLNPAFCSTLIWQAALQFHEADNTPLRFDATFLVLPTILHRQTRESLPRSTATSLAVWLNDNRLAHAHIVKHARTLSPFTKEALIFGGRHRMLLFVEDGVIADRAWEKQVRSNLHSLTNEVAACARRAAFLGRWLAKSGSADTVMALLGVRP